MRLRLLAIAFAVFVIITIVVNYWPFSSSESATLPWWRPPASGRVVSLLGQTNPNTAINLAVAIAVSFTTPTLSLRRFQEEVVSKYPDDLVWYICRTNLSQNGSAALAGNLGSERANPLSFSCERMAG